MARIRSLHPGVATDEELVAVSRDARLFYLLLLTECDDQGAFEWKPLTLKMKLFPADNIDVAPLLSELARVNKLKSYEIDGRHYGAVRNFRKWQRPKSPNSIHPTTDEIRSYVALSGGISEIDGDEHPTVPPTAEKSPQMEDVGGRRNDGGDSKKERSRGSRLPSDFTMPADWLMKAAEARRNNDLPSINLELEATQFVNYWQAKPGKDGTKLDWEKTWINWALRSRGGSNGQANRQPEFRNGALALVAEAERIAEARDG